MSKTITIFNLKFEIIILTEIIKPCPLKLLVNISIISIVYRRSLLQNLLTSGYEAAKEEKDNHQKAYCNSLLQ